MEPVFKKPDFKAISDYPVQCRLRFLQAVELRAGAPFHVDKRRYLADANSALDDYLLWKSIYDSDQ